MDDKLKETIKWFLKDTPNNAELNLKDLKTNPSQVRKAIHSLGYKLTTPFPKKIDQSKYEYNFAKKDCEHFELKIEWNILTFEIKLIKTEKQ